MAIVNVNENMGSNYFLVKRYIKMAEDVSIEIESKEMFDRFTSLLEYFKETTDPMTKFSEWIDVNEFNKDHDLIWYSVLQKYHDQYLTTAQLLQKFKEEQK